MFLPKHTTIQEIQTYACPKKGSQNKKKKPASESLQKNANPPKQRDPEMYSLLEQCFGQKETPQITDQEIIERMMLPMLIESSRCLEDEIVESPAEVDMALIFGLGFPPFRGGIFRWADEEGLERLATASEKYVELSQLYKPTEQILGMVSKGEVFHPIGG